MADFLDMALRFPALPWTVALMISVAFWTLSTVLGLGDLGFDVETDVEVEAGGAVGSNGDATADGGAAAEGESGSLFGVAGLAEAVGLAHAPLTIVVTVLSAFGWLITMLAVAAAGVDSTTPILIGILIIIGSFLAAVPVTGRLSRLIGPLFAPNRGIDRDHLLGRICTIRTGRVDENFGQAEVTDDDGAVHVIHVRCLTPNELSTGSKALVVELDDGTFLVDPDVSWSEGV